MHTLRFALIIALAAVLVSAVGCGSDCTRQSYLNDFGPLYEHWTTFLEAAPDTDGFTSVEHVTGSYAELNQILYDIDHYTPPACMKETHIKISRGIHYGADALLKM